MAVSITNETWSTTLSRGTPQVDQTRPMSCDQGRMYAGPTPLDRHNRSNPLLPGGRLLGMKLKQVSWPVWSELAKHRSHMTHVSSAWQLRHDQTISPGLKE